MHVFKSSVTATHLVLVISLLGLLSYTGEAASVYSDCICSNEPYYRLNTTFEANLKVLLSSLVSNATLHHGFYRTNISLGTPDEVKGLFLCRGDVTPSMCEQCVTTAAQNITLICANHTESIIWYDDCMLRYSNASYLNNIVPEANLTANESVLESDRKQFNEFLATTLNDLVQLALNSPSGDKFATKEAEFTSSMKLYTLAQCTPDLSTSECNTCFRSAISDFPTCCDGKRGARSLLPGCNVRYELYPFYNGSSTISTQPQLPSPSSSTSSSCINHIQE